MLDSHIVQQILRMYYVDGESIRKIAKILEISRNTVIKYIRNPNADVAFKKKQQRKSKLDAVPEKELLELCDATGANSSVLSRIIGQRYNVHVDPSTFRRYLAARHPEVLAKKPKAINSFEVEPGEQLQIDFVWIDFTFANAKEPVKLPVFEAVYAWSRKTYFRVCPDMTQASWLLSLSDCLLKNGIPKTVLCDNDAALVKRQNSVNGNKFTAAFYWLCRSLGIKIIACKPCHAYTKGRIERTGQYLRRNAFAEFNCSNDIYTVADLQTRIDQWVVDVADERHNEDTKCSIRKAFEIESKLLTHATPVQQERLRIKCGIVEVNELAVIQLYGQRIKVDYHLKNSKVYAYLRPDGKGVLCDDSGKCVQTLQLSPDVMASHRFEDQAPQHVVQLDLFDFDKQHASTAQEPADEAPDGYMSRLKAALEKKNV